MRVATLVRVQRRRERVEAEVEHDEVQREVSASSSSDRGTRCNILANHSHAVAASLHAEQNVLDHKQRQVHGLHDAAHDARAAHKVYVLQFYR